MVSMLRVDWRTTPPRAGSARRHQSRVPLPAAWTKTTPSSVTGASAFDPKLFRRDVAFVASPIVGDFSRPWVQGRTDVSARFRRVFKIIIAATQPDRDPVLEAWRLTIVTADRTNRSR